MSIQHILISLIIGYAFGNIPNGYLYAKSQGVDIYKAGSCNPGSTNVLRTLGPRAGITVLLMDIAKTIVPILLLHMYWNPRTIDEGTLITLYTGLGAILGHDYPVDHQFHGGKGVACTGALVIAFDYRLALILLAVFILIVVITKYVSLGSMIGSSLLFVSCLLFGRTGVLPMDEGIYVQTCIITFIIAALVVFQHRSNIRRLMQGKENKFGTKKKA